MKKFRHFLAMVALVLAISIFIASEPIQMVSAAVGQDLQLSKQYLSELKMFYGTSESEARSACESEGYTFCPTDLNEGGVVVELDWAANDDNNILTDIEMHTYLGYKTTEDRDDAITDVTLLDMKYSHFEEIDYQEFLDAHIEDFRDKAAKMMVLVNALAKGVEKGSPNALIAYDSLNLLYVDENKPHDAQENQFGCYLINNADITFFEKFIQRGSAMVLNKVTNLLCAATSDYEEDGTTWVDRSKVSEVAIEYANATSAKKNMYDQNCQDAAKTFVSAIRSFRDTYIEAKSRFDEYGETYGYAELEGMTEETAMEKIRAAGSSCRYPEYVDAMKTYTLLNNITYQTAGETVVSNAALLVDNGPEEVPGEETTEGTGEETQETAIEPQTFSTNLTLAQYIMDLAADDTLEDHLSTVYPIVSSMSKAQCVALELCGFGKFIEGLYQANDYPSKRTATINEAIQKLKETGLVDGRLYVWTGMDTTLYDKKVVQTDARKEAVASGVELKNAEEAARRKTQDTLAMTLNIIDMSTLAYGGIAMMLSAALGSLWTLGTNLVEIAGMYLVAEMTGMAVLSAIGGVLLCALQIINILTMVVGIVLLLYNILKWTGVFNKKEAINYEKIPDVILDARQSSTGTYSVRYDAIFSNSNDIWNRIFGSGNHSIVAIDNMLERVKGGYADIAAYMGFYDRWAVMYYTKSPAAGEPIEVTAGQQPFVTRGGHQPPDGYRSLTLIIGSSAEDVNSIQIGGKQGAPLYVFFPGTPKGKANGGIVADDGSYVTKVRLSYDDDKQNAINRLKKSNYEYYDVNLTPDKGYTYLGYVLGSEANALTDIRVSTSSANSIVFGGASYGRMGMDGKDTTPYGMTLFATSDKSAGSPIIALSLDNKRRELGSGLEPVCLFSGGNAVDIGTNWKNNILDSDTSSDVGYFTDGQLGNSGVYSYKFSKKDYSYEFMSQDDPSNGTYLYFQPKEQFKSTDANGNPAQRYIAGFSYFLAGDKDTDKDNNKFGSNYEYMQTFAKENGFELLTENGEAFRVMSDEAGEMTMATSWREVWGYPADTYNIDMYHSVQNNYVIANGDGGLSPEFNLSGAGYHLYKWLSRHGKMIYHTAMYFGISYTYNPYRAITGICGLITPYTEKNDQIKYSGMTTPAGSFQACNVSIQGCPITSAGITAGYYNPLTMSFPLYTNYEANQRSDLSWTTDKDMEVLSHYLMTSGPRAGVLPLKEGDIAFSMQEDPGQMEGFVPLCDLRTPGDYDHPMNLALDTANKGSKYLYLYLKAGAGGREENDIAAPQSNVYTAKKYVAAVFCGVGKTPEAAIADLYSTASKKWSALTQTYSDISVRPMFTELDEILPVDLSAERPWYEMCRNDTNVKSLKNGEVVRGNELADFRWYGHDREEKKTIDEYEKDWNCAYIGVVRTANSEGTATAAYGVVKYYTDAEKAPGTLECNGTNCDFAGGPVNSKEGRYFLYYSTNSGTASYSAPITGINISDDIFVNGYNTAFTVSESDRKDNKLPAFNQLRMRADEQKYIHLGYERAELPYYEALYIGVGDTKKDAFIDMVGTTNSYAATDVNCNYNSYSKKWIAIGYRRTNIKKNAIRDVFLYQGDDPPDEISIEGGYTLKTTTVAGKTKTTVAKKASDIPYYLVKHNLKSGAENLSLNEGNGEGTGLYLYYTTSAFCLERAAETEVTPITNICFAYGDISPRKATADDLAKAFARSYYGTAQFDASAYANPIWECVLGVSGSPENWKLTAEGGTRFSLNQGVRPGINGNGWGSSDNRVYMYVDRAGNSKKYNVRDSAKLPEFGYYSAESTFGFIHQVAE